MVSFTRPPYKLLTKHKHGSRAQLRKNIPKLSLKSNKINNNLNIRLSPKQNTGPHTTDKACILLSTGHNHFADRDPEGTDTALKHKE